MPESSIQIRRIHKYIWIGKILSDQALCNDPKWRGVLGEVRVNKLDGRSRDNRKKKRAKVKKSYL